MDILVLADRFDLIVEIIYRHIPVESVPRAITESTLHRTTMLGADGSDPFLSKVYLSIRNAMNLFGQTKEVGLDVVLFAVISDSQKLQSFFLIDIDFASMGFDDL